jgi:MFS family permease
MTTFLVLLTGYILSQFYRSFLAVIAPELSAELHLSATDLGNISAAWFAAFALVQFVVGAALDRIGPRRTVSVLMLAGVAGALLFSRAHSSGDAIVAMALIGVGCSPSLMGPLYVFARNHTAERFALLSAAMIGFGSIGNLLGGTPLALAQQSFGWRSVFVGLAGLSLLSALLAAALVRDPPRLSDQTWPAKSDGLREILSIRALWPIWPLMAVGYGVLITERGLWVGPYLSDIHGLAPVARGNVIFLMALAITGGAFAYGPLESWLGERRRLVLAGSAAASLGLLTLWHLPEPHIVVATVALCIFGFSGMTYGVIMAHVRRFIPEHILGRGMSFANFLCMSGAGFLQIVSGVYVDQLRASGLASYLVYARLHFALAIVLLTATVIYFWSPEKK